LHAVDHQRPGQIPQHALSALKAKDSLEDVSAWFVTPSRALKQLRGFAGLIWTKDLNGKIEKIKSSKSMSADELAF